MSQPVAPAGSYQMPVVQAMPDASNPMSQGANGNGYQPQAAYPNLAPNANQGSNTVVNVQQQQSLALSFMASQTYYDIHKKEPALPFILNFILGFGLGSFVEGDDIAGWVMLGSQLGGLGLIIGAIASGSGLCSAAYASGCIIISVSRIWGWIRPFAYADRHNKALQKDIAMGKFALISLDAFPAFEEDKGFTGGLTLQARVGF